MGEAYKKRNKELGLCLKCGEKAEVREFCALHYWTQLVSDRNYHKRNKEWRNKIKNDRRKKYKEEGKCVKCGKKLIEGDGIACVNCKSGRVLV